MEFDVFTLLPEVFPSYLESSILQRASQHGLINVRVHNIRDWATEKHHVTDDEPYGGGGEMCLWTSGDTGKTWTMKQQITRDSPLNHNYARRPRNAHDPFFAFWADGNPNKLSESRLYFCDSTGGHVWQLPYDMTREFAEPALLKS